MRYLNLISWFAAAGAITPPILYVAWMLYERYVAASFDIRSVVESVLLILWPSSILLLGITGKDSSLYFGLFISTIVNVFLYVIVVTFVWLGYEKSHVFIVIIFIILIGSWYFLLSV